MKPISFLPIVFLLISSITFAQQSESKKIHITGKVVENTSKQPLEYATIALVNNTNPKAIAGGITNSKGEFDVEVNAGVYDIKIEFISFKPIEIKAKSLTENTSLGDIGLAEDATQLDAVVVRAEATTVQIKLDKKVYSVGQDLMVKGGTVSDVLDNIPSVAVDVEGNVTLRGNDNVRILIDGRPSNAININDALRLIPADAIEKVEIITNPSARYDAEGGGGIINILLKKGKNLGVNGTLLLSGGSPENTGASGSFNFKNEQSNIFLTMGYNKRNNPGNTKINQENFDADHNLTNYIEERRRNERESEGFNGNIGIELYLDKTSSWTNTLSLRTNNGANPENVIYNNYSIIDGFTKTQRYNDLKSSSNNVEYATNYTKNFKKDGHKLTVDASFSQNNDDDYSSIYGNGLLPTFSFISSERTVNDQKQGRSLFQTDYVLPFGKGSQLEAGFKGTYSKLLTIYQVEEDALGDGNFTINTDITNTLEYKENVTAFYVNFGSKINKFSYLLGLRFEDSNIQINQFTSQDFNTKKYQNLFPSVFLNYEISDGNNITLSYSKRINRPRDRFINPFSSYSSNINLFQGNPDLNPTLIDAYDLSYLKKWGNKLTLSTSLYHNRRKDAFQFVRYESGRFIDGNPVIINSPFNLASSYNTGFEFTLNYSPFKWWKLNGNFNFYNSETAGTFTYTKSNNMLETIDFDNSATTWFSRITTKFNLPYKIDFQANGTYDAAQKTAQGKNKANASANIALSKDILKDKATIAFNVNDVFNSRKRINEVELPNVNSYSEMQWRQRQITFSFTYRFNKKKGEKEKQPKRSGDDGGNDDFQG